MTLGNDLARTDVAIRLPKAGFAKSLGVKAKGSLSDPDVPGCDRALASHSWRGVLCPGPCRNPGFLQVRAQMGVTDSGRPSSVLT